MEMFTVHKRISVFPTFNYEDNLFILFVLQKQANISGPEKKKLLLFVRLYRYQGSRVRPKLKLLGQNLSLSPAFCSLSYLGQVI